MTITTLKIVLGLISIAQQLFSWMKSQKDFNAGHDNAVATASLALLETTTQGKALRDSVRKMSETDADKLWGDMLDA